MRKVTFNGFVLIQFNHAYAENDISDLIHDLTLSLAITLRTALQLRKESLKISTRYYQVEYRISIELLPENIYNMAKILDGFAGLFQSLDEVDRCRFVLES
jgi:hypothetical protein